MQIKNLFPLLICCCVSAMMFGQEVVNVKADQEINQVFTIKDIYRYEQFLLGKVQFRDGTSAEAKMNYHKLFEQMLFIDANGDSLAVGNPETIKFIIIGNDTFYYNKGIFVELIGAVNLIRLAKRQVLQEIDEQKTGAYGQSYTNNSTVANKNYYTVDGKPRLNVGEGTLFSQKKEYYISYKQDDFVPVTKKNIEKLFDDKAKDIKDYIKTNSINFANEQDLKKLIQFISEKILS